MRERKKESERDRKKESERDRKKEREKERDRRDSSLGVGLTSPKCCVTLYTERERQKERE